MLTLYNPRENLYATSAVPATLDETLDFAREKLDIIAPAAELLYKNAAEKMLKESTSGVCRRPECCRGREDDRSSVSRSGGRLADLDRGRGKSLPRKFILTSTKVTGTPQFTVLIRNWDVTPKLTDQEFRFTPLQDRRVAILRFPPPTAARPRS
jgi:hypothetical protein